LVVEAIKKIKEGLEARFDELNGIVDVKVRDITSGKDGLQGPKGDQGDRGFDGVNGKDGYNGKDGIDGVDGKDGVGVQDAYIDFDGSLIIKLTDGTEINVGEVVPMDVAEKIKVIGNGGGTSQSVLDAIDAITNGTASLTSVNIPTNSGTSTVTKGTGITSWVYSGNSFSVTAQEATPNGLFFKPDGTAMYVVGASNDRVNQYSLSTPWNVSTASFVNFISVSAQDSSSQDVFFRPDGLTMYVVGDTNNTIFQYTLSSAWDITTASYASKTFSVATQETNPSGVWFKPDGTEMYIVGSATDAVYKYTLSTAWDVSTASYSGISFSVAAQESVPSGLSFTDDGFAMFVLGSGTDQIYQYNLSSWNIAAAYFNESVYVGFQDTAPTALFVGYGSGKAFVAGSTNDTIYEYDTQPISVYQDGASLLLKAYTRIQNNAYIDGSAKINGSLTVDGSFTLGGGITASGNLVANQISTSTSALTLGSAVSTGNTNITAAQTSGAITVGGTAGTGNITVGQSTAAQTLNLATGATATATTKTVNIGTAGVSGSTTNVNIGSAVSGATSTTTLNGFVVDSISAAVTAAGSTQATATLLTTTINNVTVVASAADGVRLPTAVAGMRMLIRNSDSADTLKICVNGSFGKLGSMYSALYAPELMIQTTITGQLCLLMLIERLEERGIRVVSANTDGIVVLARDSKAKDLENITFNWMLETSFDLERSNYRAIHSRDVNNYIAVKYDGSTKRKGIFAEPGLSKNPEFTIVADAIAARLAKNTPVKETIGVCKDVTKFVSIRRVTGGAVWRGQYLGKSVRFYYSKDVDVDEQISYAKNSNKVPKTDGARPLMTLPAECPIDIDIDRYVEMAEEGLKDMGVRL